MAGGALYNSSASLEALDSVLSLKIGETEWSPLTRLPRPLMFSAAAVVGGRMWVTGGTTEHGLKERNEVWQSSECISVMCDVKVLEYIPHPINDWREIGQLEKKKQDHRLISVSQQYLSCIRGRTSTIKRTTHNATSRCIHDQSPDHP